METQDNGFLLVIDGVRKEKERLTAAKLFVRTHGSQSILSLSISWISCHFPFQYLIQQVFSLSLCVTFSYLWSKHLLRSYSCISCLFIYFSFPDLSKIRIFCLLLLMKGWTGVLCLPNSSFMFYFLQNLFIFFFQIMDPKSFNAFKFNFFYFKY